MRDPESFDDFYAGSVGRMISQLYAMTGDRAEAEDVVKLPAGSLIVLSVEPPKRGS